MMSHALSLFHWINERINSPTALDRRTKRHGPHVGQCHFDKLFGWRLSRTTNSMVQRRYKQTHLLILIFPRSNSICSSVSPFRTISFARPLQKAKHQKNSNQLRCETLHWQSILPPMPTKAITCAKRIMALDLDSRKFYMSTWMVRNVVLCGRCNNHCNDICDEHGGSGMANIFSFCCKFRFTCRAGTIRDGITEHIITTQRSNYIKLFGQRRRSHQYHLVA